MPVTLTKALARCLALSLALCSTGAQADDTNILRNSSLEDLDPQGKPTGWFSNAVAGSGYDVEIDTQTQTDGAQSVRVFSTGTPETPFANIAQAIDASAYRGHRLRLTASVKAGSPASRHLGLWFRVDKADGTIGFFDNMQRRSITGDDWETYAIEGFVDPTATRITVGMLMVGEGAAWLDQAKLVDLGLQELEVAAAKLKSEPRVIQQAGDLAAAPLSERGRANLLAFTRLYGLVRWFHPSDAALNADWDALAVSALPAIEQASNADELAKALRQTFGPLADSLQIAAGPPKNLAPAPMPAPQGPVWQWQHYGLGGSSSVYRSNRVSRDQPEGMQTIAEPLPGGVSFRLPLYAPIVENAAAGPATPSVRFAGKPEGWTLSGHDRTTRLASIIAAWTTLDHFYPYWDVVEVDWDATLEESLSSAATAPDDKAFHLVLQRMVAGIDDGHGWVRYPNTDTAVLPIDWADLDGALVITAVADGVAGVEPGMVVTAIDGVPAQEALIEEERRISGSDHYRRAMAEQLSRYGETGEAVVLSVREATGEARSVTLTRQAPVQSGSFQEVRPAAVAAIAPDIFYIDLTRVSQAEMDQALVRVADAKGLLFDLRGYPRVNRSWLARLTDRTIRSPMFLRPEFTGPDAQARFDDDGSWIIDPVEPRLTRNVVFLTNASAISYAESLLGTVKTSGLGAIVGSPTAGANGNVSEVSLPGGYALRFTGMKVLNRDGSQHHNIGVFPDVTVLPTRQGVAAGRDEVLEAGLELLVARGERQQ